VAVTLLAGTASAVVVSTRRAELNDAAAAMLTVQADLDHLEMTAQSLRAERDLLDRDAAASRAARADVDALIREIEALEAGHLDALTPVDDPEQAVRAAELAALKGNLAELESNLAELRAERDQMWATRPEARAREWGFEAARVRRIREGDSFDVEIGGRRERVELIGIDADSRAARRFVEGLISEGDTIWLQSDGADRTGNNRLRRHVWTSVPTALTDAGQRGQFHLGQLLKDAGHAE
jgi:outer membrane murein-binding lipoprotein Lpp